MKYFFGICCIFFLSNLHAQTNLIDSLEKKLASKTTADSITMLLQLSREYSYDDIDKAIVYAQRAVRSSEKLKDTLLMLQSISSLGNKYTYARKFDSSVIYLNKAIELSNKAHNDNEYIYAATQLASVYNIMSKPDEALEMALAGNSRITDTTEASSKITNAYVLGNIYHGLKNFKQSLAFYKQGLAFATAANDSANIASLWAETGYSYYFLGDYTNSLATLQQAINYNERHDRKRGLCYTYQCIAQVYYILNDYDKAIAYGERSFAICGEIQSSSRQSGTATALGRTYMSKNEFAKAIDYLNKALSIAKQDQDISTQHTATEILSYTYYAMHDYKKGSAYEKQRDILGDSLMNEEILQKVGDAQVKYETVKKDKEIAVQNEQIAQQRLSIGALIGGIVLITFAALFFYSRNKAKQKNILQQAIIKEQQQGLQAVIEAQDEERKRIAKDLHDGVSQQLVALKFGMERVGIKLSTANPEQSDALWKLTNTLGDTFNEVRNISHTMSPAGLEEKGLVNALQQMIEKTLQPTGITHTFTASPNIGKQKENIETSIYRITQELLNNILKHSQATDVNVLLQQSSNMLQLKVMDNGKGFNFEEAKQKGSMGLFNILSRVQVMNGKFSCNFVMPHGTESLVEINLQSS